MAPWMSVVIPAYNEEMTVAGTVSAARAWLEERGASYEIVVVDNASTDRTVEVLKQGQYQPMPVEQQVMIIYAVTNGYLDQIPVSEVRAWERDFLEYLEASHGQVLADIRTKKSLDDDISNRLKVAITAFKPLFKAD